MIGNILSSGRYERILRLLDLERNVILNGPLSSLAPLIERREAAMKDLVAGKTGAPEAFLADLKTRAERNSRLLLASLAGVKAAQNQISEINSARDRLRTYSADGTSREVRQTTVTRDHRA
jgi:hypothetical protein